MITDIADYFSRGCGRCARFDTPACSVQAWAPGLATLRDLCMGAGLTETLKWGHPCYVHAGRNIAIIGAFRDNFRLSFFNAALLRDPDGILEKQGPYTQHADMIRFTADAQVSARGDVIRAYLKEAMGYAEAGLRPAKTSSIPDYPAELLDALDMDPELAEAFAALTPGRQKSYLINLSSAKQSQTRISRIAKFRDKIIAGKGAQER